MTQDPAYLKDLFSLVECIRDVCPADLTRRFGQESGIVGEDFIECQDSFTGRLAAVDGSNSFVLDSPLHAVAAVRAVASCFLDGSRDFLSKSSIRLVRMGVEDEIDDFLCIYEECFARTPDNGLESEDRAKAAAVIRDTLEYGAVLETLARLQPGDAVLIDGSLRVSHESHRPVLNEILVTAGKRDILVAGVSKHSSATWGGGLPLVLSVERFAVELGVRAPWFVKIPEDLLDRRSYRQWQRGAVLVAKLHPRSPRAFKIEVPDYADDETVKRTVAACAAYANDGRIPGYPYPLFDAHRVVSIGEDVVDAVRNDLIRGMDRLGMNWNDFQQLFGDYHEEFDRY